MEIINQNLNQIRVLCKKYSVAQLFVFGSVLNESFNLDSDIDFIVHFTEVPLFDYADNYFDLKSALEKLLNREVDLLEDKAINNPFLRNSIDTAKKLVYEA